jgi:hypothetical protein
MVPLEWGKTGALARAFMKGTVMIPLSRSVRTAAVLSVAGTAVLASLSASPASAASWPRPVIVSCKSFTVSTAPGSVGTGRGCNHRWISGGGATQTTGTGTFAVTWNSGLTTTGTDTKEVITPSKCPSAFPEEVEAFGDVTGGTARPLIGGHAHSFFCVSATERELLPGTTWNM